MDLTRLMLAFGSAPGGLMRWSAGAPRAVRATRRQVASHNVHRWVGRMLMDATRLRERGQMHRRPRPGWRDDQLQPPRS